MFMLEDKKTQAMSDIDGLIPAVIVHENADIDKFGQFPHRRFECLLRVVCGHDDRDALAVNHVYASLPKS